MVIQKSLQNYLSRYSDWTIRCWIAGFVSIIACSGYSNIQVNSENPQALMRQVVQNELEARENESIYWGYISQTQEADETRTETIIETRKGTLKRLLARNGHPLPSKQRQQEGKRIEELIANPRDLDEQKHKEHDDLQKAQSLFKLLPDAFLYTLESSDGQTIRLSFRPNPSFKPQTFESKIFRVLQGSILVDGGQKRLIELRAVMSRDYEFGWGIFGKLRKGGSFELRQEQVEPGCWVMILLSVQVTGRAWFFKSIGKRSQKLLSAFHRVPENLTLAEAAAMAKREAWEGTRE